MRYLCYNQRRSSGYATLISVLIASAVGISVAVSLLLLGLSISKTAFSEEQLRQAKSLSDACAEEALEQIRASTSFTGSGGLSIGLGSCSYAVANGGGQNRTVTVSGTVGTVVRKATVSITAITPLIVVGSWQED